MKRRAKLPLANVVTFIRSGGELDDLIRLARGKGWSKDDLELIFETATETIEQESKIQHRPKSPKRKPKNHRFPLIFALFETGLFGNEIRCAEIYLKLTSDFKVALIKALDYPDKFLMVVKKLASIPGSEFADGVNPLWYHKR